MSELPLDEHFYRDAHLFVHLRHKVVMLDGEAITLTRMEYRLLALLVKHAGEVVPRPDLFMLTPMVDTHFWRLRRKLGIYFDRHIETVIGVGYSFRPAFPHRDQGRGETSRNEAR